MIRLHQILLGWTVDEHGNRHDVPENRTKELLEILDEYDEGKAIIWCPYEDGLLKIVKALKEAYGEEAVAVFYGGNRTTRENDEWRFKNVPTCRFMVATQAAGGRGRTWDCASLMIYYGNTDNLEHRMQSEERGSAVGKDEPITYIDLCSSGTIDEKFIKAMREKINLVDTINGENFREWLI